MLPISKEAAVALTFYYGSGSPFAWKVWLILEHKGIPYEFRLLSFDRGDTKSAEFRAVNPRGKVPAIVDDGFALWESAIITEYLEERYPQKPLLPNDAQARATVRRIAAEADGYLSPAVTRLFEVALYRKDAPAPAEITAVHQQIFEELSVLEAQLAGPWLAGPISIADFAVFPHMRLLKRVNERQPGEGIAEDLIPPKLTAWMKRIEALPYYEKTIPPHWKQR
jgi:glutathione S-transferase